MAKRKTWSPESPRQAERNDENPNPREQGKGESLASVSPCLASGFAVTARKCSLFATLVSPVLARTRRRDDPEEPVRVSKSKDARAHDGGRLCLEASSSLLCARSKSIDVLFRRYL